VFKKLVYVFVGLVLAILGIAYTRPDDFKVSRELEIKAPAEKVFEQINDFKNWKNWSPWAKKDPNILITTSGAESGAGAVQQWKGNTEVGSGTQTITNSVFPSLVEIKLDFTEPMETENQVLFNIENAGESVKVKWTMQGKVLFLGKVIGLFMNMDKLIGNDFEAGLQNLKTIVEN
jgi:uncharacterized protein YndB with AHSA1/START domain